jgi:trans-2,3-dihydro-3-hydroxyanthranilate isomerase
VALRYLTYNVFTDRPFGGNPLAVVPDARGLGDEAMLAITREFNYSESSFVLPPTDPAHAARVRIFTPGGELPFAGHPTVGTAIALVTTGMVPTSGAETRVVLEEGVGPVPVTVRTGAGAPHARFSVARLPETGPKPPSRGRLAKLLGLATDDVLGGAMAPEAISCGVPFLIVPLRDVGAVSRARLRVEVWEELLQAWWAQMVLVAAFDPAGGPTHLRARMFAPGIAVPEDPATGSAIACLGGFLAERDRHRETTLAWTVDQGVEMGRPSRLEVEADKQGGVVSAIRVGGHAVPVAEGVLRV